MDIRFRDTRSAHDSAETLVEVINNYSHYLRCRTPRRHQHRPSSRGLDARTALCDLIQGAQIIFEDHCARLVARIDHPANPLHRRPLRRPA